MDTSTVPVNYTDKVFTSLKEETIIYARRGSRELHMIMFSPVDSEGKPVGEKKKPTVLCLHPGGADYRRGDPISTAKEAAMRGWIGISLEYKSGTKDSGEPMDVTNTLAAIRFLRVNHLLYGIRRRDIFLIGRSLGALTSIYANFAGKSLRDPNFPDKYPGNPEFDDEINSQWDRYPENGKDESGKTVKNRVNGVGTFSGAATNHYLEKILSKDAAPVFDYHGLKDTTVDYSQAVKTIEAMKKLGIPSTLNGDESSVAGFKELFRDEGHKVGNYDEILADLFPRFVKLFR